MKALDLFCCGGGATRGLQQAGFTVTGVDIEDQSKYYIGDEFIQRSCTDLEVDYLRSFDFIWASPPCQKFSHQTKQHKGYSDNHPDLVEPIRELLLESGVPFCIENVVGAPVRRDLTLCGKMFDLDVARHRIFEIEGFTVEQPDHPSPHPGRVITVTGNPGGTSKRDGGARFGSTAEWKEAMQIDWLPARLIKEAIPPAYSRYIAEQFLESRENDSSKNA